MPEPLFILCPGRSFSSIVAAMIGQHPQCYGLPELRVFSGETLGQAWEAKTRPGAYPMQGLKRLLAELHHGAQTDETVDLAESWVRDRWDWTGKQLMAHVQHCVGDRILVDKTPANTDGPAELRRMVSAFPNAHYLQLTRHPRARGRSEHETIAATLARRGAGHIPVPDVERKWMITHSMLQTLEAELPLGQMISVRGEELLRNLDIYLVQICEWLGIRSDADAIDEMLHPERSPFASIGPPKAMRGNNTGFLKNPILDHERLRAMPEASLDGPLDWNPDRGFAPSTRRLANEFGYR